MAENQEVETPELEAVPSNEVETQNEVDEEVVDKDDNQEAEEEEEEEESEEEEEEEEEEEDDDDIDLPWYKDEYFWLGEETSDGYDWDDRSLGYRVKKVINVNGGSIAHTIKVGLHVAWIPAILYLGAQHPVNGVKISIGDLLGAVA